MQALDTWVIGKYQSLVNLTQLKPVWWIEQCAFIILLAAIGIHAIKPDGFIGWGLFGFIIKLACVTLFFWCSKSAIALEVLNSLSLRLVILVLSIIGVTSSIMLIALTRGGLLKEIFEFTYDLAMCSAYYFAACKPPQPRRRVNKLKLINQDGL
jgi:hypothetical protein